MEIRNLINDAIMRLHKEQVEEAVIELNCGEIGEYKIVITKQNDEIKNSREG
jgi:hypothetical protein